MKFSHEVSQVGVRKALRPWSLTTLPFALALDTAAEVRDKVLRELDQPGKDRDYWLLATLAEDGEEVIALPTLGGSLPAFVFTETLGLPTFWMPAANTDNQQHDISHADVPSRHHHAQFLG